MTDYLSTIPYQRRIRPLVQIRLLDTFTSWTFRLLFIFAIAQSGAILPLKLLAAAGTAVFLPMILFMIPGGVCADRISKRSVMQLAKLAGFIIMIFGAVVYARFHGDMVSDPVSCWSVLLILFLLALQDAYFRPAFQGILPELFLERNLSRACGDLSVARYAGILLSLIITPFLTPACGTFCAWIKGKCPDWTAFLTPGGMIGLILCILALAQLFLTFQVCPTGSEGPRKNRMNHAGVWSIFRKGVAGIVSSRALLSTLVGEIIGVLIISLLPYVGYFYQKNHAVVSNNTCEQLLFIFLPLLAAGIGCCVSGRKAKDKVELGYVAIGGFCFVIFFALTGYFAWNGVMFGNTFFHLPALIFLTLSAFCIGFAVIPLRALLLNELPFDAVGSALSAADVLRYLLIAGSVPWLLAPMGCECNNPFQLLDGIFKWGSLSVLFIILAAGINTPWLFIRLLVLGLTHSFYKMRILGTENIPSQGGVLFVSNHVSYIDSMMILACTSRRVRFLMNQKYYNKFWIRPLAKLTGVIPVPDGGAHKLESMFSMIRQALANGEAVCVFPEGKISENGIMGDFKAGYGMMVPENGNIPIIPVSIGLVWGSMFTKYYSKLSLRFTARIPYPATVSFGKPLKREEAESGFKLRQAVEELSAESEILYPRDEERPLHYQLAKNAKRHPFKKVLYDQDGKGVNFFKILIGSVILSRTVRDLVPEETKYVGVYLPNTPAATLSMMGIMMADKVPSPLNFSVSRETLQLSLKKAGITHVITSRLFLAKLKMEPLPEMVFLEDVAKTIPKYRKIFWTVAAILLPHQELMNIISPVTHNDIHAIAVLLFSSGSTGIPKGVMLSHHNVNSDINTLFRVMRVDVATDSIMGSLPMFHSFGFTTCVWIPLMYTLPVAYVLSPLDAAMVGKVLERHKLTILLGTPTFMQSYMRKCSPEQFSSLRLAIVGAEKLRTDIADRFRELTGNKTTLVEGYGCTELSPIAAINVSRGTEMVGKEVGKPGSIGVAMPGMCIKIVDPATKEDLPPGTDGLMMVKGPNVMQGYVNDKALTDKVVKDGWYDTGDIANMDEDGYVTISGRLSRFSKIAGEMVPHELLECMMNEIVGLEERVLAVGSIPDKAKGEALAVLVAKGKCPMTPDEITEKLRAKGVPNLWIPRTQNYRETEEFPIMANGKMDLMKMREIIRQAFETTQG